MREGPPISQIHAINRPRLIKVGNSPHLREFREQASQEGLPQALANFLGVFNVEVCLRGVEGVDLSPLSDVGQPLLFVADHNSIFASDILPAALPQLSRSDLKENFGVVTFPFGPPPDLCNAFDPNHDGHGLYVMHHGFSRDASWKEMSGRDRVYRTLYGKMFLRENERQSLNSQSFAKAGEILKSGGAIICFPTGVSNESAFKKDSWRDGVARIINQIPAYFLNQVLIVPTYLEFETDGSARPLKQRDLNRIMLDWVTSLLFNRENEKKKIILKIGRIQSVKDILDSESRGLPQELTTKRLQEAFVTSFSPVEKPEDEFLPEPALV